MKNADIRFSFGKLDYVKAANKASREIAIESGFVATSGVFKNRKAYDRKRDRKIFVD